MKKSVDILAYIKPMFDKYKYVILVCVLGVVLLAVDRIGAPSKVTPTPEPTAVPDILGVTEDKLAQLLCSIDGVGSVHVALSKSDSEKTIYAGDENPASELGSAQSLVIISKNGEQSPVVEKITAPIYSGAVVVCEGGDNPRVQLEITQAVKALIGVSSDKIIILKMKK